MKESQETIKWNFDAAAWQGITVSQVQLWERLYDQVNVVHHLRVEMQRWFDLQTRNGVPKAIARKKDWKRFIVNWLKKEQAKAVGIL